MRRRNVKKVQLYSTLVIQQKKKEKKEKKMVDCSVLFLQVLFVDRKKDIFLMKVPMGPRSLSLHPVSVM